MLDRQKIADEYRRGLTGTQIAARFGVTVATIYYHLRLAAVKRRPSNR
ncbi:MAG: helix-turn-helix domain-containing protein, partial [Acetobacteraceae bacterium]